MRVAVGKGVEDGSSVAVGAIPVTRRVASSAEAGVAVAPGSGSAFRQPPSKTRKSNEISRMDLFTDSPVANF